jgi:hypothetical protein
MNRGRNVVMTVELRFTKPRLCDALCSTVSMASTVGQHANDKLHSMRKEMVLA